MSKNQIKQQLKKAYGEKCFLNLLGVNFRKPQEKKHNSNHHSKTNAKTLRKRKNKKRLQLKKHKNKKEFVVYYLISDVQESTRILDNCVLLSLEAYSWLIKQPESEKKRIDENLKKLKNDLDKKAEL